MLLLVAVALIKLPAETLAANVVLKIALPLPSVVTLTKPRYVWPSPKPVPSWAVLPKNSMRQSMLSMKIVMRSMPETSMISKIISMKS